MAETFLEEIKSELVNDRSKKICCQKAEIRALLIFGAAAYNGGALFGTDNYKLARRVSFLLKRTCTINLPDRPDERACGYKFLVPGDVLEELGLRAGASVEETEDCEADSCCRKAFIRGAFLAAGSAANPDRSYRMEIFSEDKKAVGKVYDILQGFGVEVKRTKRKNLYIVYAQKSESEADMLKVAEAGNAVFRVLETRVIKDRRNETNRVTNCDMANFDRAIETSARQSAAIEKIKRSGAIASLKPKLRDAAELRLEHPEASISELAEMAGISKSAMHHRLESIVKAAQDE